MESDKSDNAVDDDKMVQVSAGSTAVAILPSQMEQPEPPSPALINPSIWRPNNSDISPGKWLHSYLFLYTLAWCFITIWYQQTCLILLRILADLSGMFSRRSSWDGDGFSAFLIAAVVSASDTAPEMWIKCNRLDVGDLVFQMFPRDVFLFFKIKLTCLDISRHFKEVIHLYSLHHLPFI